MKTLLKYLAFFSLFFCVAGTVSYYAVNLYTNSAAEVITPEFRGKNILYVLETLTQMGLNAKLYGTQYNDVIPKYAVLSQDPMPGTTIKKGRDVVIFISKGPQQTVVPDLRMVELSQAGIIIEKNELSKGHLSYTWSSEIPKGLVIAQFPVPFDTVKKGAGFDLLISRGKKPEPRIMPDLVGQEIFGASTAIKSSDLHLTKITSNFKPEKQIGSVIFQSPAAGSYVLPGQDILLTINESRKNLVMSPKNLDNFYFFRFNTEPGFRKKHIRVETDLFGPILNLYDEYIPAGQDVTLLFPAMKKTHIRFYVDENLKKIIMIDPWLPDRIIGDTTWELLPPQFYQQILQNSVTNLPQ